VTGLPGGNFVVLADSSVHVLGAHATEVLAATVTDGTCPTINLAPSDPLGFRPVAVGDVLAGGLDEIVLSGLVGGKGTVVYLQWDGTSLLPCPAKTLTFGNSQSFGTSLAIEDFDGDGKMDLAVGSPPDKVYVFFGQLDAVTVPSVTITNTGTTLFGKKVASYRLPGMAAAQLLVSDPAAAVGGRAGAGKVMLFNITRTLATLTDLDAVATLFDSNQDAETGKFGDNLGGVVFNTQLCAPGAALQLVPWVSNSTDVLAFFNYPGAAGDPRCFAVKP